MLSWMNPSKSNVSQLMTALSFMRWMLHNFTTSCSRVSFKRPLDYQSPDSLSKNLPVNGVREILELPATLRSRLHSLSQEEKKS